MASIKTPETLVRHAELLRCNWFFWLSDYEKHFIKRIVELLRIKQNYAPYLHIVAAELIKDLKLSVDQKTVILKLEELLK